MDPLPNVNVVLREILCGLTRDEETLDRECNLLRRLNELPKSENNSKPNTPSSKCRPEFLKGGYEKKKLRVSINNRPFEYKNIDDLLERVVSEDDLKGESTVDGNDLLTRVQRVAREGAPPDMVDGIDLVNSYINQRTRSKEEIPRKNFVNQLNNCFEEDLKEFSLYDENIILQLRKYINVKGKLSSTKSTIPQRPMKEVSDWKTIDKCVKDRRNLIQADINRALIKDLNSPPHRSILPSVYRAVIALSDIEKLETAIIVTDRFT